MTNYRLPVVVPAIPPKPPVLSLLNSALRPDKTTDPALGEGNQATPEQLEALPADLRTELEARKGEAWTRGITYAPENHWAAELRDACDNTSYDAPALEAPRDKVGGTKSCKLTEEAGTSTIPNEALEYQVTAVNANGQTTARTIVSITPAAGKVVKVTWKKVDEEDTAIKGAPTGTTYNIYRAKGTGKPLLYATAGPFDFDQTAEYLDKNSGTEQVGKEPPASNTTGGGGKYANLATVEAIPYIILAQDYCSTFGFEMRDFKGRAERLLENGQHAAIEKEFWGGALAQKAGLPNNYLAKTGTAEELEAGKKPSVARGLQVLQDYLQQCGFGGQGMIHTQAQTAPNFLGARRVGGYLLDVFDNFLIPGVGYTAEAGNGPGGKAAATGCAWMYATDLVSCRVEDKPTIFSESFSEATDWGQAGEPNTIRMRAQKFAIAYADFACCAAVEVELAK